MHYQYDQEGTGRDKHYQWRYDAIKNTAYNVKAQQEINVDYLLVKLFQVKSDVKQFEAQLTGLEVDGQVITSPLSTEKAKK